MAAYPQNYRLIRQMVTKTEHPVTPPFFPAHVISTHISGVIQYAHFRREICVVRSKFVYSTQQIIGQYAALFLCSTHKICVQYAHIRMYSTHQKKGE